MPDSALAFPCAVTAWTVNAYVTRLVSPVTVRAVAAELNTTGVWRAIPIHGVTTYAVIGAGAANGGCHDTTACLSPGAAVPMSGGGSATHADSPNATNATTTTAKPNRNGLTERAISAPRCPLDAPYS